MSDTTASSPPAAIETHDPIPEANWFWRRTFSFLFVGIMLIGMWWIGSIEHELAVKDPPLGIERFYGMFRYVVLLTFISNTYYMVAPSAEQVTRMWQTASLFKSGVTSTVTQIAEDATTGSKVTATQTTGATGTPVVAQSPPASNYDGPPTADIPSPDPSTPSEPQWPK